MEKIPKIRSPNNKILITDGHTCIPIIGLTPTVREQNTIQVQITPRIDHYVRRRSRNFGVLKPILRSHDRQLTTLQNKQDCLINDEQINDTIGSPLQAVSLPSLKDTQITQGLQPFLPNFFLSNVRSISNKADELGVVLQKNCIDFAGITETWLNSNIPDSRINIHDFNLIRKDRSDQRGSGSLCICKMKHPICTSSRAMLPRLRHSMGKNSTLSTATGIFMYSCWSCISSTTG